MDPDAEVVFPLSSYRLLHLSRKETLFEYFEATLEMVDVANEQVVASADRFVFAHAQLDDHCEAILIPGEGNIGNVFHYVNGCFDVHQRVYAITQFSPDVSAKFIYLIMAQYFGKHALKNTVKATVDSLRLPTFLSFEFLFPPAIDEQPLWPKS